MIELSRLAVPAGGLALALACGLLALRTDPRRLRESPGGRRMMWTAAVLVIAVVPVLALDAAGTLGVPGLAAGGGLAAGALMAALRGRRITATVRLALARVPFTLGRARVESVEGPPRAVRARVGNLGAATLRTPAMFVAVSDDGHRVELNQN